ncbi:MAG: thioredoxin [Treponema sp.]
MALVHLTKADFDTSISSKETALVDFWAPWCGPCKMLGPIFEEAEKEIGDKALLAKVNVDNEADLAAQYRVSSIPTIIVFKNGKEVSRSVGFIDKQKIISLVG